MGMGVGEGMGVGVKSVVGGGNVEWLMGGVMLESCCLSSRSLQADGIDAFLTEMTHLTLCSDP